MLRGERGRPGARRRRILVVDDDDLVRDAVAMILHEEKYEVDTAGTRAEVLRLLEQRTYDVILSDLRIPGLDGPVLYHELKQRRPEAVHHLVFMTGSAREYARFLEKIGVPVLAKPFTPEHLRQTVQRALAPPGATC